VSPLKSTRVLSPISFNYDGVVGEPTDPDENLVQETLAERKSIERRLPLSALSNQSVRKRDTSSGVQSGSKVASTSKKSTLTKEARDMFEEAFFAANPQIGSSKFFGEQESPRPPRMAPSGKAYSSPSSKTRSREPRCSYEDEESSGESDSEWLLDAAGDTISMEDDPNELGTKADCPICNKPVTHDTKGIFCEKCESWYHPVCQHLSDNEYASYTEKDQRGFYDFTCQRCSYLKAVGKQKGTAEKNIIGLAKKKAKPKVEKPIFQTQEEGFNEDIFDFPDHLKLKSSMTLFSCVKNADPVFEAVLARFFEGKPDSRTLDLLSKI
jgi:hypothetical protein